MRHCKRVLSVRLTLFVALAMLLMATAITQAAADVSYWYRYKNYKDWEEEFIQDVNDRTGVAVDLTVTGGGDYYDKVKVAISGDVGPDLFNVTTLTVPEFAANNLLHDLTPFFERSVDRDELFMPVVDGGRYPSDGPLYAIPINYVVSTLYFNKDLFAQAGVDVPNESWTWDDLRDAAKKLTRQTGDENTRVYGFGQSLSNYTDLQPAIVSNGGAFLNADQTAAAVNNPIAADTVRFFRDMVASGISALPEQVDSSSFLDTGRVAMTIQGSWRGKTYNKAGINYGIAMLPKGKAGRVIYGASDMMAMSAKAKDPVKAWEVLKESLVGRRPSFYTRTGWIPINKEIASDPRVAEGFNAQGLDYNVLLESAKYMRHTASLNWSAWLGHVIPIFHQALSGEMSPEEAVARAQEVINNDINETASK